jgi:hypothetical protein
MLDWIASAMKNYKGSDIDITTPRPMVNSPVREGVADAELLFKRPMNFTTPMLNSPTHGTAAGDAFYARVVRRVAAWQDGYVSGCNCSICRDVH